MITSLKQAMARNQDSRGVLLDPNPRALKMERALERKTTRKRTLKRKRMKWIPTQKLAIHRKNHLTPPRLESRLKSRWLKAHKKILTKRGRRLNGK